MQGGAWICFASLTPAFFTAAALPVPDASDVPSIPAVGGRVPAYDPIPVNVTAVVPGVSEATEKKLEGLPTRAIWTAFTCVWVLLLICVVKCPVSVPFPHEDMEVARQAVGSGERIIAVFRAEPHNVENTVLRGTCPFVVMSFCCPMACHCYPCVIGYAGCRKRSLLGTLYILTDQKLYRYLYHHSHRCALSFGVPQVGGTSLHQIHSFSTEAYGGCESVTKPCFPTTQVVMGVPPRDVLANTGGAKRLPRTHCTILVDDAERAVELIRGAKDDLESGRCASAPMQMDMDFG